MSRAISDLLVDYDAMTPQQQRQVLIHLTLTSPAAFIDAVDCATEAWREAGIR
ncbi:hypothetical protein [Rhodococcus sp. Q]|uniref:hypothetical protein n=1 Tax=Rhodococcus sp. Q TaxID=2502252 RepID=UPI001485499A|nr:hypothetical protein [Rhodococcus sp. Q]